MTRDVIIQKAAQDHTDLHTFHAVMVLMEGGLLYDEKSKAAASKIIAICKREASRCLRSYDAGRAALSNSAEEA